MAWKRTCKNPDCRARYMPTLPGQKACSPECAVVVGRIDRDKKLEAIGRSRLRKERHKDAETRERLMTITQRMDRAQKVMNKWIRYVRDKDEPCISCGIWVAAKDADAGHYRTIGHGGAALRFVDDNVNKQCVQCNRDKGGNTIEYRKGLLRKIGEERTQSLEVDLPPFKPTEEWVEGIRSDYTARLRAAGINP